MQMGTHILVEELQKRSRLVVSYAKEIDYKNGKLWEMERKLEEKDRLLQEYNRGRIEKQNLIEENGKLKFELETRSIKDKDGRMKYELQLQNVTTENEKLKYELASNKKELRRAYMQKNAVFADMKRIKHKVVSETEEFELRFKELEVHDAIFNKEKLQKLEDRANKADKESILSKEQLEELQRRLNEVLHQKEDFERKFSIFRAENCILVKQLREELIDYESKLQESRKLNSFLNENIQLLKEKLLEEKSRVKRAESEIMKLSEIQLLAKRLEAELSSWMMIKEIPGVSCAADVLVKFAALQKEVTESRVKSSEANARLKQMDEQLEELRRRVNECLLQKNNLEKELSSCRTENNILVKQLREELRDYESELQKARKLQFENVKQLKHELLEEKGARERAESELLKFSEIQLQAKRLENELSSWKMIIKNIPGVSCADDLPLKFADLQKELLKSMEKVTEANTNLKQMEELLEAHTKRLNECLHQKSDLEKNLSTFRTELVEQLQQELGDYESELYEVKLKYSHENIEVMKEKDHRERAELNLLNLSDDEIKPKKLEGKFCSWKMMIKEIPGMSCANDTPLKFAALRNEVEKSMAKAGEDDVQGKQMEMQEEI